MGDLLFTMAPSRSSQPTCMNIINKTNLGSDCLNSGGQAANSEVTSPRMSDDVGYVHAFMSIIGGQGRTAYSVSSLEARRDVSNIDERVGEDNRDTGNYIKLATFDVHFVFLRVTKIIQRRIVEV